MPSTDLSAALLMPGLAPESAVTNANSTATAQPEDGGAEAFAAVLEDQTNKLNKAPEPIDFSVSAVDQVLPSLPVGGTAVAPDTRLLPEALGVAEAVPEEPATLDGGAEGTGSSPAPGLWSFASLFGKDLPAGRQAGDSETEEGAAEHPEDLTLSSLAVPVPVSEPGAAAMPVEPPAQGLAAAAFAPVAPGAPGNAVAPAPGHLAEPAASAAPPRTEAVPAQGLPAGQTAGVGRAALPLADAPLPASSNDSPLAPGPEIETPAPELPTSASPASHSARGIPADAAGVPDPLPTGMGVPSSTAPAANRMVSGGEGVALAAATADAAAPVPVPAGAVSGARDPAASAQPAPPRPAPRFAGAGEASPPPSPGSSPTRDTDLSLEGAMARGELPRPAVPPVAVAPSAPAAPPGADSRGDTPEMPAAVPGFTTATVPRAAESAPGPAVSAPGQPPAGAEPRREIPVPTPGAAVASDASGGQEPGQAELRGADPRASSAAPTPTALAAFPPRDAFPFTGALASELRPVKSAASERTGVAPSVDPPINPAIGEPSVGPAMPGTDGAVADGAALPAALDRLADLARAADPATPLPSSGAREMAATPGLGAAAPLGAARALDVPVPPTPPGAPLPMLLAAATGTLGSELGEKILWLSGHNLRGAEIQLDPPELGPLQIQIHSHRDGTSVQFLTHTAVARDAVESSLPRLRELLEGSGVSLMDVNVSQQQRQGQRQDEAPALAPSGLRDRLAAVGQGPAEPARRRAVGLVDAYA